MGLCARVWVLVLDYIWLCSTVGVDTQFGALVVASRTSGWRLACLVFVCIHETSWISGVDLWDLVAACAIVLAAEPWPLK